MFDLEPERDWDDEPSEQEIRELIKQIKREYIRQYKLQTNSSETLALPKPFYECADARDLQQHVSYIAARRSLEITVFTAKTLLPERYFYLFDEMLDNWLPLVH